MDGNYEPGNVRWADKRTQARNRRWAVMIDVNGQMMHLVDVVRGIGPVTMSTYRRRLNKGWTPQDAAMTPVSRKRAAP